MYVRLFRRLSSGVCVPVLHPLLSSLPPSVFVMGFLLLCGDTAVVVNRVAVRYVIIVTTSRGRGRYSLYLVLSTYSTPAVGLSRDTIIYIYRLYGTSAGWSILQASVFRLLLKTYVIWKYAAQQVTKVPD